MNEPTSTAEHSGSQEQNHSTEFNRVVGKCPEIEVEMNHIPIRCLLDSGSQVTTITESCFNSRFQDKADTLKSSSWIKLSASNGLEIPTKGLLTIDIQIQGKVFRDAHVLVVQDPIDVDMKRTKEKTPGIIGCNILQKMYQDYQQQTAEEQMYSSDVKRGLKQYEARVGFCQKI